MDKSIVSFYRFLHIFWILFLTMMLTKNLFDFTSWMLHRDRWVSLFDVRVLNTCHPCLKITHTLYFIHSLLVFFLFAASFSLSLAMFEALRGLRDAVAPESGNSTAATNNNSAPDFEEFWQNYRNGDEETVAAVLRHGVAPQKREDYIRVYQSVERERDAELVATLATRVLEKSADVQHLVSNVTGMDRTRTQQMARIQELLEMNRVMEMELKEAHALALRKRSEVRASLQKQTCQALGIEECRD